MPHLRLPLSRGLLALLLVASATGCERKLHLPLVPDQRPVLTLTQAPAGGNTAYFYSYEIRWTAYDPDGRVDHYEFVVDPPTAAGADTPWVRTTDNRRTFVFESGDPDSLGTKEAPGGFHVFALKAVDDRGLQSEPQVRAFYSFTVAPIVTFTQPKANHLLQPLLPSSTTIHWTGLDPDGVNTTQPVKYKWKLLSFASTDFPMIEALLRPDSLRRYYAPNFAGWDSTGPDSTQVHLYNLTPNGQYLFNVVAFDEAGAYTSVFSLDDNMLYFTVSYIGAFGPRITLFNEFFNYTYASGGYNDVPEQYIHVEVPGGEPVNFYWYAVPNPGNTMRSYRWVLDPDRLDDNTPRSDEELDTKHWSTKSLNITSCTLGPFTGTGTNGGTEEHLFYLEAEDNNGLTSLGIVDFTVVTPTLDQDLLFVDDTRFAVDQLAPGSLDSVRVPSGNWPSAAELDTFLFARGGVHWRYYPTGTLSPPGVFSGYHYDTVGTRGSRTGTVPLAVLARYRNVVWYTDVAYDYVGPTSDVRLPMPVLRAMSGPQMTNTLASYIRLGGRVWLMGGGAALNSLLPWNDPSNDVAGRPVFDAARGELAPGRMMYDAAHWRSQIATYKTRQATRYAGLQGDWPGAPDYSRLPQQLRERTPTTDPLTPLRGYSQYYVTSYELEYLSMPNKVIEDVDPDPERYQFESVLDTLYLTAGSPAPVGRPNMTLYHGHENPTFVFSGFPLWYFTRQNVLDLADFVLQDVWGLRRDPVSRDLVPVPAVIPLRATAPTRRAPAKPAAHPARVAARPPGAVR